MKLWVDKFKNAFRGFVLLIRDFSVKIQLVLLVIACLFFMYLGISATEWIAVVLCFALVIVAEMVNTVIEKTLDYIQPKQDAKIRNLKDMGAGFVLTACLFAIVVACIIIGGNI
ncbi:hypothetical protein A4S06_04740 [Erysipelotrichaceae bacterium MTC7]|nr:hypothetical protein A4S06_04740 [Erysipelotrichaceae bacterium MTC7]